MWKILIEKTGNLKNPALLFMQGEYKEIKKIWEEKIIPLWDFSWGPLYDDGFVITKEGVRYWLKPIK